jgi:diguanylate cyclase (GGDEF)-like protein
MIGTEPRNDEAARLKALHSLQLLDTPPEAEFDDLVQLAAAICGTPISLITLLDENRQWFKASIGMDVRETPRDIAFCAHAIQQTSPFIVADATLDARFADNPLVTGSPDIRFYAGIPLTTAEGLVMGTLCIIDRIPRELTAQQIGALRVLADQVSANMELRVHRRVLRDLLEEKDAIASGLRASEELFRTFMNNSPVAAFIKDSADRLVFCNTLYAETFGGSVPGDGGDPASRPAKAVEITGEVPDRAGRITRWKSFQFPCRDAMGHSLTGCVAIDVTDDMERSAEITRYQQELETANDRLRNLSVTDELTRLHNRRAFEERLVFEFSMARRKGRSLAVVLLDADNFKLVNDRLGHQAGDAVLQQVAKVLQHTVRATDLVVRYGGEEFAVILPESDQANAEMWCRRLQLALADAVWQHGPVTVSMGVAAITPRCANGNELVAMADRALYEAKRLGKNRIVLSTSL